MVCDQRKWSFRIRTAGQEMTEDAELVMKHMQNSNWGIFWQVIRETIQD